MKTNKKRVMRGRPFSEDNESGSVVKPPFASRKGPAAVSAVKNRKELRKELRKAKKAQKHQYLLVKVGRADLVKKAAEEIEKAGKKKRKKKKKKKKRKGGDESGKEGARGNEEGDMEEENDHDDDDVDEVAEFVKEAKQNKGLERADIGLEVKKEEEKLKREIEAMRKKRLIEENEEEERNINQLSKKLKLNKKAVIPASFRTDGLDYVLEACEQASGDKSKKKGKKTEDETDDQDQNYSDDEDDSGSDLGSEEMEFDDEDGDVGESEEENDDEDEGDGELETEVFGSEDEADLDSEEDGLEGSGDEEVEGKSKRNKTTAKISKQKGKNEEEGDGVWEDIYGRMRSKDGAVLSNKEIDEDKQPSKPVISSGKYVPPMLRGNQTQREKIAKQLKGLLNRLSESNMHSIANQVEEMYMSHSRNEMNETLLELLTAALVRNTIMPERVVLEHIMLIAILHANVGTEVGAFFVQTFTQDFKSKYDAWNSEAAEEDKYLENIILIISFIYHFKIVDACLMYDILKFLGDSFTPKDVELILTVLKSVGFRLRKDDPAALKELIITLQQKASKLQTGSAKVKFMLEVLMAIRNNNMNKIPNYDPSFGEHLQKILKSHLHPGTYVSELKIGLQDLLNANKSGRWWIVGSAWAGAQSNSQNLDTESTNVPSSEDKEKHAKLMKRARAQGMNTDTRRNIFCVLMTAEDYMDAFEKLNHLDLRNNQDREIMHVTVYCCLQEKKFNPYYGLIVSKFCSADRKLMLALQYNLWDRLKDLKSLSGNQRTNLAQILVHLINDRSLQLSTLKVIEYTEMDKVKLKFLKKVLTGILMQKDLENLQEIFIKPALSEKLGLFRESLRLFLSHFMLQTSITISDGTVIESAISPEEMEALKQRVKIAEKCMTLGKSSVLL